MSNSELPVKEVERIVQNHIQERHPEAADVQTPFAQLRPSGVWVVVALFDDPAEERRGSPVDRVGVYFIEARTGKVTSSHEGPTFAR